MFTAAEAFKLAEEKTNHQETFRAICELLDLRIRDAAERGKYNCEIVVCNALSQVLSSVENYLNNLGFHVTIECGVNSNTIKVSWNLRH